MIEDQNFNHDSQGDDFELNADVEYQTWKKSAPYYYETLVSHLLEWPTLTCQFMPTSEEISEGGFMTQKIIIGTNSCENETNYLMIFNTRIPSSQAEQLSGQNNSSFSKSLEIGLKPEFTCFEIDKKIAHPGEVIKARCAYGASNLIATKAINGNVYLFDSSKLPSSPRDGEYYPQLILTGNTAQGFPLDWRNTKELQLISGDNDGNICLWDLEKSSIKCNSNSDATKDNINGIRNQKNIKVPYLMKFENNGKTVNEVKFHRIHSNIFSCASEDSTISFWDLRSGVDPFIKVIAHHSEVFSLDFSYSDEFLLLSGAADGLIKLWDIRKMVLPIHSFENHKDQVLRVEWNPLNESLFASSSDDKSVNIWDCSKIGNDKESENHLEGSPGLLFKHRGHKGRVDDICWNPAREFGILSADSSNLLQLWEMDDEIYYEDI
jgi:histone-binding protein RBBP4